MKLRSPFDLDLTEAQGITLALAYACAAFMILGFTIWVMIEVSALLVLAALALLVGYIILKIGVV